VSLGTLALIMLLAALGRLLWRGLRFASLKRCAQASVVRPCPRRWGEHSTECDICSIHYSHVLGSPAAIKGRSFLVCLAPTLRSAHSDKTCSYQDAQGRCSTGLWPL
jgi:hypothetical protein